MRNSPSTAIAALTLAVERPKDNVEMIRMRTFPQDVTFELFRSGRYQMKRGRVGLINLFHPSEHNFR
jgi:hypothetical protein